MAYGVQVRPRQTLSGRLEGCPLWIQRGGRRHCYLPPWRKRGKEEEDGERETGEVGQGLSGSGAVEEMGESINTAEKCVERCWIIFMIEGKEGAGYLAKDSNL